MNEDRGRSPGATGSEVGSNPQGRGREERPQADDPATRGREALDEAKQKASSLGHEAKAQGKAALSRQKEGAADQFGAVASALHSAADELQDRDQAQAGRFMSYAAEQLETFGRRIRTKDVDALIDDASRMGRRSPAAFFAGSLAVGFLLSRFLKSSHAQRERESNDSSDDGARSESTSLSTQASQPKQDEASADATIGTSGAPAAELYGSRFPGSASVYAGDTLSRDQDRGAALDTNRGRFE